MTPCLRPEEFMAVLDGDGLPAARRGHLAECAACSGACADLAATLADLRRTDVPEPPPFFWAGMNARLRAEVQTASPSPFTVANGTAWWRWGTVVPLAGMAAIIMALAGAVERAPAGSAPVGEAVQPTVTSTGAIDREASDADDALALVLDLAGTMPDMADDSLGLVALPDLEAAASSSLSDIEQQALAEILRAAVDRSKS